jgi:hypothetical protein
LIVIGYILLFIIIFFAIIFFLLGVFFAIFAPRVASWGIQLLLKMGRKLKELLGTEENILIKLQGPFARLSFSTWWVRIVGILLSAFAAWGLYSVLTNVLFRLF